MEVLERKGKLCNTKGAFNFYLNFTITNIFSKHNMDF